MRVVATAGHVDHGKSTLVRALTGTEPDRWAEERRRGMTIDLGYAWTALPSGEVLGFVDVPGHQRFLGNTLAGLGPAPAVLFVVAADEGWRRQSAEHLAAVDALGLAHGLLVVTRSDLADPAAAVAEAHEQLGRSSLGGCEAVTVSGTSGQGLDALRGALDRLVGALPAPDLAAPVRLWVDRSFTVRGAGTVVTGTLAAGTVRVGDALQLGARTVRVRGLQSLGAPHAEVAAVARVALNLRGVDKGEVSRGDVLLSPGTWRATELLDVRLQADPRSLPSELLLHVGTAAVPAQVRPLGERTARLRLRRPLPLRAGDRGLLRDPGAQVVASGLVVLDADPPPLRRRGAAAARGAALAGAGVVPDVVVEVARRGAVTRVHLQELGVPLDDVAGLVGVGDWLVDPGTWRRWQGQVAAAVDRHAEADPLAAGLPLEAARRAAGVPDASLLRAVLEAAGLLSADGVVRRPGAARSLGPAEPAVHELQRRLAAAPFSAPEADELTALGLGVRELAAAASTGRLLRLPGEVVLGPDAPARAMRLLAGLPQPFTVSAARQVLGTSRRVAVPLLEHLDGRGWTRRVDRSLREVVR